MSGGCNVVLSPLKEDNNVPSDPLAGLDVPFRGGKGGEREGKKERDRRDGRKHFVSHPPPKYNSAYGLAVVDGSMTYSPLRILQNIRRRCSAQREASNGQTRAQLTHRAKVY